MMNYRSIFFNILILFVPAFEVAAQENQVAVKPALFSVKPSQGHSFRLMNPCYPFHGSKNSIVRIAPVLAKLIGASSNDGTNTVQLKFTSSVYVLIALPQGQQLNNANAQLVIDSALTITGLPPFAIYKVAYKKGWQTVNYQSKDGFVAGVIGVSQQLSNENAHLPDGRLWRPYITDGFTDSMRLFEIIGGPDKPVIDEGMPGTEGIQGGFEGGTCVKVGNMYHMFPTERAGEAGMEAYYDRVKTRIGHWESTDAIHWKRVGTIYQASGKYAIAEEDNPMNDRRAAIWSYNAVFNEKEDRWYGYYLTYTVDRNIQPNHSFGRIWCTKSKTKGMEGIGGPYDEGQLIMEPGLDAQPWEGRQGVASFYPFPVKDGWLGFYAGAYPFKTWADYPKNTGTGWFIGLAKSASMDGPWKRLDTTVNPVKNINPEFVENPLVYKLQNGAYITVFDGGPDGGAHHFPNMIGYTLSKDGVHWSEARYLPFQTKVKRWWSTMRTPLCLIPEGDNVYTIIYAAYNQPNKRFHPMGMVKVKMDPKVLEELLKGL
jgi:hypothetical protein